MPVRRLILDLEDAVAPDAKPAAREAACAAASGGRYGRRELTIRVNGADTDGTPTTWPPPAQPGRTRSSYPR